MDAHKPTTPPSVLYLAEAAEVLGLSPAALRSRLHRGAGPRPMRLAGRLCWRPADLEAYVDLEAQRQGVAYAAQAQPQQVHQQDPPRRRRGRPRKQQQ